MGIKYSHEGRMESTETSSLSSSTIVPYGTSELDAVAGVKGQDCSLLLRVLL